MSSVALPSAPAKRPRRRLRRVRRVFRQTGVCLLGLVVILGLNGAMRKPKAGQSAWFNARSMITFPLGKGAFPESNSELTYSMTEGWSRTPLSLQPGRQVVTAVGAPPVVKSIKIDLSEASLDTKKEKPPQISRKAPVERTVRVERLELEAQQVKVERSTLNLSLAANDARLDLRRDKAGDPLFTLTDMKDGTAEFSIKVEDIEALILAAAKEDASKIGMNVQSVDITATAEDDRTLNVGMKVKSKFAFVGAGLMFTASVHIDDDMNAKLTNLRCWGDDVLGPVIIGIMQPALRKYDDREKPIMSFPNSDMKLRDVRLRVDDSIHVKAEFGRT